MDYKKLIDLCENGVDVLFVGEYKNGLVEVITGKRTGGYYDSNAIAVDALVYETKKKAKWTPIGYIARDKNAELALILDEGKEASIKISEITGDGISKHFGVNVFISYETKRKLTRSADAKLVKDIFGNEIFYDDTLHQYTNALGEVYLSGSQYAGQFESPFDAEMISGKMANKFGLSSDEAELIRDMWALKAEASASFGTAIHAALELYGKYKWLAEKVDKETHFHDNPVLKQAVSSFYAEYPNLDGVRYESLVVDHKMKRAGRIDRLEYCLEDDSWYIADFKGLAIDTPIPTPNGFVNMGDLLVGDKVFTRDGSECTIVNKSSVHHKKCYKITFGNGEIVTADYDHRWLIVGNRNRSIQDMSEKIVESHELTKGDRIFTSKDVKYKSKSTLPIDPYVLGVWLADGNRTCGTICEGDDLIFDEIRKRGYILSDDHNMNSEKASSRTVYGMVTHLKSLGILNNKHIPNMYLTSSYEQRLDLLRGYFDGDGYWNKVRSRMVMSTTNERQANDIVALVSSLGVQVSKIKHKVSGFGLEKIGWSVSFANVINPFLVRNQDIELVDRTKRSTLNYIKSTELIDTVPTQCIEVDSPDHTYLFGYHYIPTHNTNFDIKKNLKKYWKQLSFYAAILIANGCKVKGLKIYHYTGDKWDTIVGDVINIDEVK